MSPLTYSLILCSHILNFTNLLHLDSNNPLCRHINTILQKGFSVHYEIAKAHQHIYLCISFPLNHDTCHMYICCILCLSPAPGHHGEFKAEVPLLLHHTPLGSTTRDSSPPTPPEPYCILALSASVPASSLSFSTSSIILQPVPLDITISAQYSLLLHNFPR